MKKRTRNIIIATVTLIVLFFYGTRNFENDKNDLLKIKSLAANGNVRAAISKMEETPSFSNLAINIVYIYWKGKFNSRFIERDEVIEDDTDNEVIIAISNIFRDYWVSSSLEEEKQTILDSLLFNSLYEYMLDNSLTNLSKSELEKTSFEEVKKVINDQNANASSFYLNETYGIKIWDKQTEREYIIELPKDTLTISIVFIENYILKGLADFITVGSAQDGGWASTEENRLFCHKGEYNLGSEKFKMSYLKHEANHFVDILKYPNLSSPDLEYRSKLIEFMYDETRAHILLADFINSASNENRNNSHSYANYVIISGLSKKIFSTDYESNISKWKTIPLAKIKKAAKQLYNKSNEQLSIDKNVNKII